MVGLEGVRRAELVLESGDSAGYLDSRMLRPWWMPYPMARGEERSMKRREAILTFILYGIVEILRGCCYKAERGIVWLGSPYFRYSYSFGVSTTFF